MSQSNSPRHICNTPSARAAGDDPETARREAEPSPTHSTKLLKKAIELAEDTFREESLKGAGPPPMRVALEAVVPFFRKQGAEEERVRLKEALLDETILDEAEEAYKDSPVGGRQALTRAFTAALDTLEADHE